jgi:hypothetical protein
MADYSDIFKDTYNPVVLNDHTATFPPWLLADNNIIDINTLPKKRNQTKEDQVIQFHLDLYDATKWFSYVEKWSPKSIFVPILDEDIALLIECDQSVYDKVASKDSQYLQRYQFVKRVNDHHIGSKELKRLTIWLKS